MKLNNKVTQLTQIIKPAVIACGVELWGIEFLPQGKRSLLRIYIDIPEKQPLTDDLASLDQSLNTKPPAVTIDDCAAVTHQVSGVLEVHDPIAGEYVLEVSSPGLNRMFFSVQQMQDYIGETIELRLIQAITDKNSKRRKIKAQLKKIDEQWLYLTNNDGDYKIALNNIDKASLVYQ